MKSTTAKIPTRDDIDSIVDGLLADPSRADDVKGALRARFSSVAPDAVLTHIRAVDPALPVRSSAVTTDEDDLWENVPV